MGSEIELVSDGDGVAIFGDTHEIDLFLTSEGLASRPIPHRTNLGSTFAAGSGVAHAAAQAAEQSGRWVKLTEDSAKAMKLSQMMKGRTPGVNRAITTTKNGKITGILEIVKPGSIGSILTNPAMLAGAAGIMAQLAMQQQMDEIADYLEKIDEKVEDVLRAQKDAALAEMIGVGLVIDEAMTVREHTGRVSEVTWSKVQVGPHAIATTQAYALRRLNTLAEKIESKQHNVTDVAELAATAQSEVQEWLAVLARCFQLLDALAVLELDRVLDAEPAELERHRVGLRAAREKRHEQVSQVTRSLLVRMDEAATSANDKTLLHPFKSGHVVRASNHVATDIVTFNERIGIDSGRDLIEGKRWIIAVGEARDSAVKAGGEGVGAVRRFGMKTFSGAKAAGEKLGQEVSDRLPRRGATPDDEQG